MNIDLLNRVADQIEAHPENLAMDNWAVADLDIEEVTGPPIDAVPECGTAACVAGWTLIESGYEPTYSVRMIQHERGGKWYRARNLSFWTAPNGTRWDAHQSGFIASLELGYVDSNEDPDEPEEAMICPMVRIGGHEEARLFYSTWFGPKTIVHLLRQWAENPDTEYLDLPKEWVVTK